MPLSFKNLFNCNNFIVLYQCKQCDFCTNEKIHYLHHICGTPNKNEVMYKECDRCSTGSHSILYILRHRKKHKRNSDEDSQTMFKKFTCDYCFFATAKERYLRNHLKLEHEIDCRIIQLECQRCKWESKTMPNLRHPVDCKHIKGKARKLYLCTECTFKTFFPYDLKRHKIARHTPSHLIPWYHCSKCNFKSKRSHYIKSHMESKHPNVELQQQFQCLACSFVTNLNHNLRRHVKEMHSTNITWFACGECSYKSKRRQHLRRHIASQHSR